jgi:hypothetical protein
MDEIRVLPRRFPKAGKTKPNMPDSTSRLVESLVAHPSWDNHLSSKARKVVKKSREFSVTAFYNRYEVIYNAVCSEK